ncbi:hypothetical protein BBO99_00008547 [Phytophthora kernoviae]|uniref:Uncharacterized protein n=1 Tax=Phytophthora kernoviae TaxID=325452 RepID=A0A3R7GZ86_9STRA|nr:hypothetical protein BBI17_008486 [Phytophthora kernoviae]RLN75099.1 hypothetical protein BBO99_00008547 [Phytophthora kernoviae]
MGRKRKKDNCAEEGNVVDETQDFNAIPPLFELMVDTQDSVAIPLPFETVSETQGSDAKVDDVTDALSQLPPPSQEPLAPPTYRIKEMIKEINSSSRRTGIKGHASGPIKSFVEALKRRAIVIPMDEYWTSITCSYCHQRLKQTRLFNKIKRKEDEESVRQKYLLPMKEVKEVVETTSRSVFMYTYST